MKPDITRDQMLYLISFVLNHITIEMQEFEDSNAEVLEKAEEAEQIDLLAHNVHTFLTKIKNKQIVCVDRNGDTFIIEGDLLSDMPETDSNKYNRN